MHFDCIDQGLQKVAISWVGRVVFVEFVSGAFFLLGQSLLGIQEEKRAALTSIVTLLIDFHIGRAVFLAAKRAKHSSPL